MNSWQSELTKTLLTHVDEVHTPSLDQIGIYHTYREQALRQVPIHQPSIVFVLDGTKVLEQKQERVSAVGGNMISIAGNTTLALANIPSTESGTYLAATVGFSDEVIERYRRLNPAQSNRLHHSGSLEKVSISDALGSSLLQWVQLCQRQIVSPALHQSRSMELLALLDETHGLDALLAQHKPSWKNKVLNLIQADISANWSLGDVCQTLGTSESSLRRHLQEDQTNFRNLLEDSRLLAALAKLQESYQPISQVALDVGYSNQGHFSERFKKRFGMSPRELRITREPDIKALG